MTHPLPASRIDASGRPVVDMTAVFQLAWPMFLNSALQAVLNLTDTWFVANISAEATAAVGAIFFLIMVCLFVVGGVGLGVQTLVAQSFGAENFPRATRITWSAFWLALLSLPLCGVLACQGAALIHPFGLASGIERDAISFWGPRLWGGPLSIALWVLTGFFNGIGQSTVTLRLMAATAVGNVFFNALCIQGLGMGVAGAGWGTSLAQGLGVLIGLFYFLSDRFQDRFETRRLWRGAWADARAALGLGIPTGLFPAVDVIGFALFQLMMSKLGVMDGAATQLTMMLTSLGYLPAIGIGMAGTTLVGQSIGAGDPRWAKKLGNRTILIAMIYMGGLGVFFALFGDHMLRVFLDIHDPHGEETIALARHLLWIAACYQLFDAVNLVCAFCLRGAADVRAPTLWLLLSNTLIFLPLTHALSFAPHQGYVDFLPALGWGAVGGWIAALFYIFFLAVLLFARWHSGVWQKLKVA
jgi:MATE family multidrug resistance protein